MVDQEVFKKLNPKIKTVICNKTHPYYDGKDCINC
jgi:hypothetical protein